jgi:hypothetical protein
LATIQDPPWRIAGLLAEDGLAVIYGPSGVGKSFAALSLAFCVALGRPFFGRTVSPGPVVIVLLEGFGRYRYRIEALQRYLDLENIPNLYVVRDPLYPHDTQCVGEYIAAVQAQVDERIALTVIDTLARAKSGTDEDKNAHHALTTDGLRSIQAAVGGAILGVGHTGWNEERLRGAYSQKADGDLIIKMSKEDYGLMLEVEKVRDDEGGQRWPAELIRHGDSLVFRPTEGDPVPDSGGLGTKDLKALETLSQVALSDGIGATAWMRASGIPDSTFYRHLKRVVEGGYVSALSRGKYTVSPKGRELLSLPNHSHGTPTGAREPLPPTPHPSRVGVVEVLGQRRNERKSEPDYETSEREAITDAD